MPSADAMQSEMIVRFIPGVLTRNPYLELLAGALAEEGVAVHQAGFRYLTPAWLFRQRLDVQVIHQHWFHNYHQRRSLHLSALGAAYLAALLRLARRLGYGLVWTVHNLQPHERRHRRLDDWLSRLILRLGVPIVHCQAAADAVRQRFGYGGPIQVAPHGNYVGVYPPPPAAKQEARAQLGLPADALIFLHAGVIRPYKGIPALVRQFARLPARHAALVVAGEEHESDLRAELAGELRDDERIILRLGWLPDEELALYLAAADVAVTSFARVLTSGSVLLAMSAGLPVVAPALGCIPETVSDGGILYDPADPDGLVRALRAATTADLPALGRAAYEAALGQSWAQTAAGVVEAYRLSRSD